MTTENTNEWNADVYDSGHSFVYEAAADLVDLLDPEPAERVLDLGCGTGQLSQAIANKGATVVGTDRSSDMVAQACAAHPDLSFVRADARALPFARSFDAVFSNAMLHWINDAAQDNVIGQVRHVLSPGDRFVAELGGSGNVARVLDGLQAVLADHNIEFEDPWYFPSVAEYTTRLERQGFEIRMARLFDRPTRLEDGDLGLRNWLDLFGDSFFAGFTADKRKTILRDIEDYLRSDLYDGDGWTIDYRRLRFIAVAVAND